MEVKKYGRHWAVWDGDELVVVAVYKKGAEEVRRRLVGVTHAKKQKEVAYAVS